MASNPENIWIRFFTDAGLPSGISATYALTFTENRMQMNMLLDLNKEYLREMGISRMGDIISILRHAKQVAEELGRERVLGIASPQHPPLARVPVATVAGRPGTAKAVTPAIRMLEHYTRKSAGSPTPPPPATFGVVRIAASANKRKVVTPTCLPALATKRCLSPGSEPEAVEDAEEGDSGESGEGTGPGPIPNPNPSLSKRFRKTVTQKNEVSNPSSSVSMQKKNSSSVFSRLGLNDESKPKITITGLKKPVSISTSGGTIFSRLGGKEETLEVAGRRDSSDSNEPLKYEGILKGTPPTSHRERCIKKSVSVSAPRKEPLPAKKGGTMRADEEPVNVRDKLPLSLQQRKSVKFSSHIEYKEIEKRATAPSSGSATVTSVATVARPLPVVRTVAMSKVVIPSSKKFVPRTSFALLSSKANVKTRLGKTSPINKRSKSSVFGRLGIASRM